MTINHDWPLYRDKGETPPYIIGVLQYTRSTPGLDRLFRILISVFGKGAGRNCYADVGGLMPSGNIYSAAWDKRGTLDRLHKVCTIDELRLMVYKTCDDLKLTDEEAEDLFVQVRRWIKDYTGDQGEFTLRKKFEYVQWANRKNA
jgi:hypothetical protein